MTFFIFWVLYFYLKIIRDKRTNKVESSSSSSSSEPNGTSSSDEEIAQDPSVEVRLWLGKDYSNSYREDFKDISDFARGILNSLI